jgi:hypothetical protein
MHYVHTLSYVVSIPSKEGGGESQEAWRVIRRCGGGIFRFSAIHREDPDSEGEARFIAVGQGGLGGILVVVYTLRGSEIRLISARHATHREVKDYEI